MFKVSVKDFGPIAEGSVDLKPLTIFVGPSNAGKSYLAMLIYSLVRALASPGLPVRLIGQPYPGLYFRFGQTTEAIGEYHSDPQGEFVSNARHALEKWLEATDDRLFETTDIPFSGFSSELQSIIINGLLKGSMQFVEQSLNSELQRCHGELSDLRRRSETATNLEVKFEQYPLIGLNLESSDSRLEVTESNLNFQDSRINLPPWSLIRSARGHLLGRSQEDLGYATIGFLEELLSACWTTLFKEFPHNSYYLPAARSGIAQGHKAIASILVRQSSFAAIQPLEIPTLSGIITDFISHILTMERGIRFRTGSELEDVITFLERGVLEGKIDIEQSGEISYPEISYEPFKGQPNMSKFPFHRTSSMVSELAPVILFLKYLVNPGDLLVLEEPESHLHPASQRQMARGIARLVNKGVKVILTTHSDYFIAQLNNLLKLGSASRQKRSKEGYIAEDCLNSEDVAAYHFKLDDESGGSIVHELPITSDIGINEEEFAAVSEALYEETVSLQRVRVK